MRWIGLPAVGPLTAALKDSNATLRNGAAQVLAGFIDTRADDALLAGLSTHDTTVIAGAIAFFTARGDPDSESALVDALDKSGTMATAQELLNCGNLRLEAAANRWAQQHGYQIKTEPGEAGDLWGSNAEFDSEQGQEQSR